MPLQKKERLAMIYKILADAPAVGSRIEALDLIQSAFRRVEDTHSGLPEIPQDKDRMYPPTQDMETDLPDNPDVKRYRHTHHYTLIADNGAFEMRRFVYGLQDGKKRIVKEEIDFSKSGLDGIGIKLPVKN